MKYRFQWQQLSLFGLDIQLSGNFVHWSALMQTFTFLIQVTGCSGILRPSSTFCTIEVDGS
jgi:hypothetical protein